MALENHGSGKIYLSIADGKLVRSFKEANAATKQRITKTGKVVHEQHFDSIVGIITGITKKTNDYGDWLEVSMADGEEQYNVSMQFSSRYSSSLLKFIPGLNITNPVKIMPWSMTDKKDATKKVTGITVWQNDGNGWVKINPFFTKDDPKGLPQMKQVTVKGKTVWDDTDMMQFLFDAAVNALAGSNPF